VDTFLEAFASEAEARYGACRVPLDDETATLAARNGTAHLV
jgi:hypothetical protein